MSMARFHLGFASNRPAAFDGVRYTIWIATCAGISSLPPIIARGASARIPTIVSRAPHLRNLEHSDVSLGRLYGSCDSFRQNACFVREPYASATPST
jgi:hypothetical protein